MEINGWKIEKIVHSCGDVAFKISNENNYFCFSRPDYDFDKTGIFFDFFESITSDEVLIDEAKKQEECNDLLIAENQSLKAENARLQAIIDEANAQEPVGVFNGKFNVSINDKITFEVNCYDALPEAGAKLYAAPIPAQQSQGNLPITSGLRHKLIWILWHYQGAKSDIGQPVRKLLGIGQFERLTDKQVEIAKAQHEVFMNHFFPERQSPRITEQDARDIAQHFMNWGSLNCSDSPVDDWIRQDGQAMLNKLNNSQ